MFDSIVLDEDVPDPGYSVIKQRRPQSVHSTSSKQNQPGQSGRRSPVYAVVDKTQKTKNRQTVHLAENVTQEISPPPTMPIENPYSEVDRTKKSKGNSASHGGARPKVKNNHLPSQSMLPSTSRNVPNGAVRDGLDPGYQTIASVIPDSQPADDGSDMYDDPNYDSIPTDPNYDRIRERNMDAIDGGSDYDPNYESVTTLTASITGSSAAVRSPTEPGVAREIPMSGSPASHPAGGIFRQREHIYQDIDEAKGGSFHGTSQPPRVAPHSTAL